MSSLSLTLYVTHTPCNRKWTQRYWFNTAEIFRAPAFKIFTQSNLRNRKRREKRKEKRSRKRRGAAMQPIVPLSHYHPVFYPLNNYTDRYPLSMVFLLFGR